MLLHQNFLVSPPLKRPKRSPTKDVKRYHTIIWDIIRAFYTINLQATLLKKPEPLLTLSKRKIK